MEKPLLATPEILSNQSVHNSITSVGKSSMQRCMLVFYEQHVPQAPFNTHVPPFYFLEGKKKFFVHPKKKVNMTSGIKTSASLQYNKRKLTLWGCPGNLIASQHCTQEPK